MTPDVARRLEALEAAAADPGGALLGEALGDDAELVRERAIALAARWWPPERLAALVADEHDVARRNSALVALERQGPYAVPHLEAMTRGPDAEVIMFAAQVLARVADPGSTTTLLGLLDHPEPNVVQAAAEALGNVRARAAVPGLLALLDRDLWLQLAAVVALGQIGDERAAPALLAAADDPLLTAPALEALARVAAPASLARLVTRVCAAEHAATRALALGALASILERRTLSLTARRQLGAAVARGDLGDALAAALDGDDAELARAAALVVLAARLAPLLPQVLARAAEPAELAWMHAAVARQRAAVALVPLCSAQGARVREAALRLGAARLLDGEALVALAYDRDAGVRAAACTALGERPEIDAAALLATRLACGEPDEEAAAAAALARLPERARLVLRSYLAPGAPVPRRERLAALGALAGTRGDVLTADLLALSADADGEIRAAAVAALARRSGGALASRLFAALADPAPAVRVAAITALGARGLRSAIPALVERLAASGPERLAAARALGALEAHAAVPALCAAFVGASAFEQLELLAALVRLGGAATRRFLVACLDAPALEVRRTAARGLAELLGTAPADGLALLVRLGRDPDWHVRHAAAAGLGRLAAAPAPLPPPARDLLLELVRDLDAVVAQAARTALATARARSHR